MDGEWIIMINLMMVNDGYPLVNVYITNWKDPPCITMLLMEKITISMVIFDGYVNVYRRVYCR